MQVSEQHSKEKLFRNGALKSSVALFNIIHSFIFFSDTPAIFIKHGCNAFVMNVFMMSESVGWWSTVRKIHSLRHTSYDGLMLANCPTSSEWVPGGNTGKVNHTS